MKINTEEQPSYWQARVWLDGVEVGTADSPYRYCFEADDEAGYVKCRTKPFNGDEITHRGTVVIELPKGTP